ncbi:MAG: DUF6279 family lipoprotein [Caldimonas sp.]
MITMFNTLPSPDRLRRTARPTIIAVLSLAAAVLAGGCSMVKLGYGQASPFAFRWLDGYVDFDDAQSLRVRGGLDEWFAWHRRNQLPDYAELLARAQAEAVADITPERMCAWAGDVRGRIESALERALPTITEVLPTLTPTQITNIEKRQREKNQEYREEFVQRDPVKRKREAVKREIERAEGFYGPLDDRQRALVTRNVAASPFDGEVAYSERVLRQQDALAVIRRLAATPIAREDAAAQIRAYLRRVERSPREGYRAYADRLLAHNCAFASILHNATSAAQKRAAASKLKGYENALRELAAEGAG